MFQTTEKVYSWITSKTGILADQTIRNAAWTVKPIFTCVMIPPGITLSYLLFPYTDFEETTSF